MHRLANTGLAQALCSAAGALALPPPNYAIIPATWAVNNGYSSSVPAEVEVSLWADAARALSAAALYGAIPRAFAPAALSGLVGTAAVAASLDLSTKTTHENTVIAAAAAGAAPTVLGNGLTIAFVQSAGAPAAGALTNVGPAYTFTFKGGVTTVANFEAAIAASVDLVVKTPGTGANVLAASVDEFSASALTGAADAFFTKSAHGLLTGDGPFQLTDSGGTLPTGAALATDYWIVKTGASTLSIAASLANALAGIVVEFSTAGSGTIVATADSTCQRIHWHSATLLGLAGDGVISLDAQASYWDVRKHSPQFVAYAVVATFGSGAGLVSGEVRPRVDG